MKQLNLVLLWHMHQPDYRDYVTNQFVLPWVYLHAIKDYTDMAYHLESHPKTKAVVNFVPVLLDQLDDFAQQFSTKQIRCPLLRLLATPELENITMQDRLYIFDSCFLSNHENMLQPYPAYKRLHELYQVFNKVSERELKYFSGQYLADLLVWYHLAWMGESVRRNNEFVMKLMTKNQEFNYEDRLQLFTLIGELIQDLIPRYRKLAESGQIELSTTPHYHPLAPLLIDFSSARDSQLDVTLPEHNVYPGGRSRVAFHLSSAITSHTQRFNEKPAGVWPAEGALSAALIKIMAKQDCQWSASGEGVLVNSLRSSFPDASLLDRNHYLYRPYRIDGESKDIICFFRDDQLSDLIGFEYSKWFGRDAAENFVQSLDHIYHSTPVEGDPVVSVILDGENAWESYPYNGFYFLDDLYHLLDDHPYIRTTTYRDYLASVEVNAIEALPTLAAGSWVYGTFSTWIGDKEKNCAWDMLCAAKHSFDLVMQSERLTEEEKNQASRQLASCESSDWFWWFGDYNPAHSVASFDQLFRKNLMNLYHLLKLPIPSAILEPVSKGNEWSEDSGAMRRSSSNAD
ncbi:glycoside hydrolase family 57 protein [Nitrosomonas ureae]|uniref:Alpha-amylase/alpha-mannosidase (GH57 family) n=1 Tax=Nitrosomonas ureae TaxID=44577 RepID=A0A1H9CRJ7_9PROT|nr:glycoside hydrolase family 57 protein [Nitrosomonas ureae]PTQ85341.1 alpha-amylase/alpha-mannosidase (GH57 family) [Nitrosomonas ureae]SEQ03850.1 Alpha-amylase/alpha-mannosidase, GH57 family [Nitrosomonas ureae]